MTPKSGTGHRALAAAALVRAARDAKRGDGAALTWLVESDQAGDWLQWCGLAQRWVRRWARQLEVDNGR